MKAESSDWIVSLLNYAVLAPSSHNTQPWHFTITDNTISLYADRTRALPANDPDDRELTISCGCALMNLRVAAAHFGFNASCNITPDSADDDLFAVVSLSKTQTMTTDEAMLFDSIELRRTYRKRFEANDVPEPVQRSLSITASEEGAWLDVIETESTRHKIATLVAEGDSIQWSNPSWRRELAAWLHPHRRGDGLTVPGVVAPIAQSVIRTFDMGNGVAAKDKQLADESPLIAVIGTDGDNVKDWLAAGQALQKVLLSAHSRGLQASFLNQPVQLAPLRAELQTLLGRNGYPQILLRLGFPTDEIKATPRRDIEQVID
jgi:nitroreductase